MREIQRRGNGSTPRRGSLRTVSTGEPRQEEEVPDEDGSSPWPLAVMGVLALVALILFGIRYFGP